MSKTMKDWVPPLFFWGGLLWLSTFNLSKLAVENGYSLVADALNGYMVGVITTFSGWIAWQIKQGNGYKFIDQNPFFKWPSILSLVFIFFIGFVGFLADIFGDTSWAFNITFALGGVYVSQGLVPFIRHSDGYA